MRIANKNIVITLLLLALPVVASATQIASVDLSPDCLGWSSDVTIRFRSTVYSVDVDYTATIMDSDGNVLEVMTWDGVLTRDEGSYLTHLFNLYDEWTVVAPAGDYDVSLRVHVYAPYDGGVDERELVVDGSFYCETVAVEVATWGSVKSLYR